MLARPDATIHDHGVIIANRVTYGGKGFNGASSMVRHPEDLMRSASAACASIVTASGLMTMLHNSSCVAAPSVDLAWPPVKGIFEAVAQIADPL